METPENKTARRFFLGLVVALVVVIGWAIGNQYANPDIPDNRPDSENIPVSPNWQPPARGSSAY